MSKMNITLKNQDYCDYCSYSSAILNTDENTFKWLCNSHKLTSCSPSAEVYREATNDDQRKTIVLTDILLAKCRLLNYKVRCEASTKSILVKYKSILVKYYDMKLNES